LSDGSPLGVERLDDDVHGHLSQLGEVFVEIPNHDSGNTSWGVRIGDDRWFVKYAPHMEGVVWLLTAQRFHAAVRHDAIVPLERLVPVTGGGMAAVYRWVDGEILNDPFVPGSKPREEEDSAYRRFRALPMARLLEALDVIFDAHRAVVAEGYVAVDFYDGCVIYDFDTGRVSLVDLDLYWPGPYMLDTGRQFGSTRFMAPEEFRRGATIDERTTVFTMGRTAFVFLSEDLRGDARRELWRAEDALYEVAHRATAPDPDKRWPSLSEFLDAWRAAAANSTSD
jgi:serine/threonine-protein kinase